MTHIELRKLRHVAVLSRTESFVRAAEELNLTQSALTRSIQSIEAQLDIRLFDRDRSGVHLTVLGREFLKRAQSILLETDDLGRAMAQLAKGEVGQVAFGLSALPAKLYLKPILLDLLQSKQEAHFSVAVRDPDELLELLEADKIEFFLGSYVPVTRETTLEVSEIAEIQATFMVRSGHPLLQRRSVTQRDLKPYPILQSLFDPGSRGTYRLLTEHSHTVSTDDYNTLMQITLSSDALWLTSALINSDSLPHPELVRLNFNLKATESRMTLKSVKLARRTLSPMAKEILDEFISRCRRIS